MLWEVDVLPGTGRPDRTAERLVNAAKLAGIEGLRIASARGYLLEGDALNEQSVKQIAEELFTDRVVEKAVYASLTDSSLTDSPAGFSKGSPALLQVMPKTGVMDPTANSAEGAIADLGHAGVTVRTLHKYWVEGLPEGGSQAFGERLLANDAIEQLVVGPLSLETLDGGRPYKFELLHTKLSGLDDVALMELSLTGQLYLQLAEMQTIQKYFGDLGRDPTDIELETIAQTWSEHCSHKTLAGRIAYRDESGERHFENMLKETIFAATNTLRQQWSESDRDWCVSVFKDNAGIVRFDEEDNVCFKVETHNHPSALEPYGGANTGMGGVIRDTLGTGLGAKPICSTDVFCFAPPETPDAELPAGVLPPRRVMEGVVEGVRDYGNRMGIPTVNGAVCFDKRYLGNPLVYCGNVGIIPRDKSFGDPQPNDLIVTLGGRTGRDGIHGATFSSAELTSESETLSGGAVQIGNAIEEKKVADVMLQARDLGLYSAVTDCGAGGFSSAVGEMGEEIGAQVWLEKAPLKYEGLSYTEIWISEAQERMVFAVPDEKWKEFHELSAAEGVEATVIGRFVPGGDLHLVYDGELVGELSMDFLHNGRPPVVREATYLPAAAQPFELPKDHNATEDLLAILSSLNVASKEWVIRQYDHEVQGGSVVKPLVGVCTDGPSDAAVVRPKLSSRRGLVIGCGINPRYGDLDTYRMAASAIDEAIRNCVAVGADPDQIALLDNFCWGDCEKSETLGSLVRAAIACHDLSLAFEAPFISGKDSLNNEFSFFDDNGEKQTIAIPATLLISAMAQIEDVANAITMDFKQAGNSIYLVGATRAELGGSHFGMVSDVEGGVAPKVDTAKARETFRNLHQAIKAGTVSACHDLSEGGLAVSLAEMAFASGLGVDADIAHCPTEGDFASANERLMATLFSETNSRFVCEVAADKVEQFKSLLGNVAHASLGKVTENDRFELRAFKRSIISTDIAQLKEAWQAPLRW